MSVRPYEPELPPQADIPALMVRWDGLVLSVDATTLSTVVRKATQGVEEIRDVLVEPDGGNLLVRVRVHRFITFSIQARFSHFRFRDGYLGFVFEELRVGLFPVWNRLIHAVVKRQDSPRLTYYPAERILVVDLDRVLPDELSLHVRDVVCEGGELKLYFGPCSYRIDRLLAELGRVALDED